MMARAMAVRTASAWPYTPPPATVTAMSSFSAFLPAMKIGSSIFRRARRGSTISIGTLLTRTLPVPLTALARATAVLRLPEVLTTFLAMGSGLLLAGLGVQGAHAAVAGGGGAAQPGGELGDGEERLRLAPGGLDGAGLRVGELLGDAEVGLDALVGGAAGGRL